MGLISELKELVGAAREKDPAATNAFEIIMTYSGVHAIVNHRIANWMYRNKIPLLPRMISQCSRFFTGISNQLTGLFCCVIIFSSFNLIFLFYLQVY